MKRLRTLVFLIVLVVIAALLIVMRPRRYEATFYPMGGIPFKIVTYGRNIFEFDSDLNAVEKRVAELEAVFNRYKKGSELSRLNRQAGVAPFVISADMQRVLSLSRRWHRVSGGAFDPSVVPLIDLWKRAGESGRSPTADEVDAARGLVGLDHVSMVSGDRILFATEGMGLDLGAIAKGLIVDAAVDLLRQRGVKKGLVEGGGDAYAFGGGTFRFGIQDPEVKDALIGTIEVNEGAVVSSGDYERYMVIGDKRYSHIVDPRTGYPADTGLVSATVVGGSAADADALATALMVLGLEKGVELLGRLGGVGAVLIKKGDAGFEVWSSQDLTGRLNLVGDWQGRLHTF